MALDVTHQLQVLTQLHVKEKLPCTIVPKYMSKPPLSINNTCFVHCLHKQTEEYKKYGSTATDTTGASCQDKAKNILHTQHSGLHGRYQINKQLLATASNCCSHRWQTHQHYRVINFVVVYHTNVICKCNKTQYPVLSDLEIDSQSGESHTALSKFANVKIKPADKKKRLQSRTTTKNKTFSTNRRWLPPPKYPGNKPTADTETKDILPISQYQSIVTMEQLVEVGIIFGTHTFNSFDKCKCKHDTYKRFAIYSKPERKFITKWRFLEADQRSR